MPEDKDPTPTPTPPEPPAPPPPPEPPAPPTPPEPPAPPIDPTGPPAWEAPPTATGEILPALPEAVVRGGVPKAAVIGALLAVSVAVAAVAVVKSAGSDSTADIATVIPADVLGYVRVSVEPSGAQRDDLRRLLGKLSAERRAQITTGFDEALANLIDTPGGDFARDVKPWIGSQIAVSAYAGGGDPAIVGTFGVRDEALARAFYAKRAKPGGAVLEVANGIGYVARSAAQIAAFRAGANTASLASDPGYRKELAAAGGDGLVVVWVNGDQIGTHASDIAGILGGVVGAIPGLSASAGSGVFVVRAEADGIAFVGHQSGGPASTQKPGRPRLLEGAPATVLGGLSIFDIKGSIEQFASTVAGSGGQDPLAAASGVLKVVGLDLQKDVLAWLGGEVAAVASPLLEFGVIAEITDENAYARTIAVIPLLVPGLGGEMKEETNGFTVTSGQGAFSLRKAAGKVAIAFAQTESAARVFAQKLLTGGGATLGASPTFSAAFGAPSDKTVFQMFVNLTALTPFLASLGDPGVLRSFSSAAARVTVSDGGSSVRFVITLADQ